MNVTFKKSRKNQWSLNPTVTFHIKSSWLQQTYFILYAFVLEFPIWKFNFHSISVMFKLLWDIFNWFDLLLYLIFLQLKIKTGNRLRSIESHFEIRNKAYFQFNQTVFQRKVFSTSGLQIQVRMSFFFSELFQFGFVVTFEIQ